MSFFVLADKFNDGGPMINLRKGGFKNKDAAVTAASRFTNSMVQTFNGKKFVVVYARIKGQVI